MSSSNKSIRRVYAALAGFLIAATLAPSVVLAQGTLNNPIIVNPAPLTPIVPQTQQNGPVAPGEQEINDAVEAGQSLEFDRQATELLNQQNDAQQTGQPAPGEVEINDAAGVQGDSSTLDNAIAAANQPPKDGGEDGGEKSLCSWSSFTSGGAFAACLSGIVYIFTVGIMTPFTYVAATLFEISLSFAISGTTYATNVVATGWEISRDLANMFFIFILIYISFSLILSLEDVHVKKTLVRVIVAALIINFSFFLSRVVIDVGNLLAFQFYNNISAAAAPTSTGAINLFGIQVGQPKAVTSGIMQGVSLQGLLGNKAYDNWVKNAGFITVLSTLVFLFLSMGILLALLAYAFFAAAIKFISRIITLWFTIILSPFAFALWAVPHMEGFAHKWWDTHFKNALYPAGFLFIFYILTIFMGDMASSGGLLGGVFSNLNGAQGNSLQQLALLVAEAALRVIFVIALLMAAIKAGDWFGIYGSGKINSFAKSMTGRFTAGFAGQLGRRTVGAGMYNLSRSERFRDAAANSAVLRTLWKGTDKLGRSSFDMRSAPAGIGGALSEAGIGGKAQGAGGFVSMQDKRAKETEELAKKLKSTDEEKRAAERKVEDRVVDIDASTGQKVTYKQQAERAKKSVEDGDKVIKEVEKDIGDTNEALKSAQAELMTSGTFAAQEKVNRLLNERKRLEQAKKEAEARKKEGEKIQKEFQKAKDDAKNAVGNADKARIDTYAENLESRNMENLWMPSPGSRKGAINARKLVHEKSDKDKLWDAVQNAQKHSTPPPPPTAAPAPKEEAHDDHGGGGHGGGGGHH